MLVNMTLKFRRFQKIHTCLTSCQTTSGAPIGDLIVAFCTHFIFRKSHERTAPNAEQKFLLIQKLSWVIFTHKRNTRVKCRLQEERLLQMNQFTHKYILQIPNHEFYCSYQTLYFSLFQQSESESECKCLTLERRQRSFWPLHVAQHFLANLLFWGFQMTNFVV